MLPKSSHNPIYLSAMDLYCLLRAHLWRFAQDQTWFSKRHLNRQILYQMDMTFLPGATRTEQSTLGGTRSRHKHWQGNEWTNHVRESYASGRKGERSAHRVKAAEENLRIWGGGGEKSAFEPGLCNGNHMVGDCGSDAPRLLGEAARQPTPFRKQEENISSVWIRDDTVCIRKKGRRGPGKGERRGGWSP